MKVLDVVSSNLTLTIRTTKDHAHIETTRDAIYFITSLAQLFGLMPLNRTKEEDVNSVGYSRKSWRFVFSLYNLLGATVSMVFCIVRFNATGILLDKTGRCDIFNITFNFKFHSMFLNNLKSGQILLLDLSLSKSNNFDSFLFIL